MNPLATARIPSIAARCESIVGTTGGAGGNVESGEAMNAADGEVESVPFEGGIP
jgi:hypothetical protein